MRSPLRPLLLALAVLAAITLAAPSSAACTIPAAAQGESADATGPSWQDRIDEQMQEVNTELGKFIFFPIPVPLTKAPIDDATGEPARTRIPYFGSDEKPVEVQTLTIPFAVLWLVLGAIFFTVRMGFVQFRLVGHAIQITRGKYDDPEDEGEVSHFEALSAALSATVGLGNIAGVAIAISIGGPGATFWMIMAGLLGMASKFTECTLGQLYRQERSDGSVMGGAMYYLSLGLREKGGAFTFLGRFLAIFFAILCIGGSLAGGNSFQVNQSLGALGEVIPFFRDANGDPTNGYVYGILMTIAAGAVIIGGLRRIADVASRIVPTMCGIYVLACLFVILSSASAIPAAFGTIVAGAFTPAAGLGGIVGVLIVGFQRAAFSNEAGVGSAAIAHSAAKTKYAIREGIVALLEPMIDTVIVCTMTALVIVITGAYVAVDPATGQDTVFASYLADRNGAGLTSQAFASAIPWFRYVLGVAVVLFAFSTMISWSYYGERCFAWLFGDGFGLVYKILFLSFTFIGSVITAQAVLDFGDLMILGMAIPNVIGVVLLSGKVRAKLDEYMALKRAGEM
ncbi:MAG: alanine/glycine:cation symporter family protein [Planctomycetota bacterium]